MQGVPGPIKAVARGGYSGAHAVRAPPGLKFPVSIVETPKAVALRGSGNSVSCSIIRTSEARKRGTPGGAAAEIARLERLLCKAHGAKRDAELQPQELRDSVESLTQQVAELSASLHAYRCSSFMPSGQRPLALEDRSMAREDEEKSEQQFTAVYDDSSCMRMPGRVPRRSVHCVPTRSVATGHHKLCKRVTHACM